MDLQIVQPLIVNYIELGIMVLCGSMGVVILVETTVYGISKAFKLLKI